MERGWTNGIEIEPRRPRPIVPSETVHNDVERKIKAKKVKGPWELRWKKRLEKECVLGLLDSEWFGKRKRRTRRVGVVIIASKVRLYGMHRP